MSAIHKLLTDHIDIWTAAESEKKSGRGRSAGNAVSVYGIKKLRELILELAVRGKLVPQDPSDELASELLKRILAEKAQLIARGVLKKSKPTISVSGDEVPFELPSGWEWVRLPDISFYNVGKTPSTKNSLYWADGGEGYNWVSIADLNHNGTVEETTKHITEKAISDVFKCDPAPAGAILMSFKLTLGKVSILKKPAFHNEAIISIYPYQGILQDYLFKILPASAMAGNSKSAIKGNTLNAESIAALLIAIPPFSEQQRIVAKVDELMALCDQLETQHNNAAEAHEKLVSHLLGTLTQSQSAEDFSDNWQRIAAHFDTLFTTEASIDALKQTLLQLAVMGKLVPQDPNEEPASKLVRRKTLISSENVPFLIPDNWIWACVDELAETRLGKMLDNAKNKGTPLRYLRNINVRWFDFDLSDVKEMRFEDSELEEFSLECGDVLVCEGGYPGRAAVWDEREDNIYFQKALHRVRLQEKVNPYYFVKVLRESADSGRLATYFTGAGIQHFTGKGLKTFLVPLPPFEEQNRVVAKVDELMVLCDQLKSRLTDANQLQQKLADVMVEQAVA